MLMGLIFPNKLEPIMVLHPFSMTMTTAAASLLLGPQHRAPLFSINMAFRPFIVRAIFSAAVVVPQYLTVGTLIPTI